MGCMHSCMYERVGAPAREERLPAAMDKQAEAQARRGRASSIALASTELGAQL